MQRTNACAWRARREAHRGARHTDGTEASGMCDAYPSTPSTASARAECRQPLSAAKLIRTGIPAARFPAAVFVRNARPDNVARGTRGCRICAGTGLTPCHIRAGTGLTPCHIRAGTGLIPSCSMPVAGTGHAGTALVGSVARARPLAPRMGCRGCAGGAAAAPVQGSCTLPQPRTAWKPSPRNSRTRRRIARRGVAWRGVAWRGVAVLGPQTDSYAVRVLVAC